MAHYILDKAYTITDANGVSANRVVVQGANAGDANLPAAANADSLLGVTVHSQPNTGHCVAVRKAGIARVLAAGVISVGAAVNIDDEGRVKAIDEQQGTKVHCLGFAESAATAEDDLIEVFIALHDRVA